MMAESPGALGKWVRANKEWAALLGFLVVSFVIGTLLNVTGEPAEPSSGLPKPSAGYSGPDTEPADGTDSGGGQRKMQGSWKIRIDPDRTIAVVLNGSFDVTDNKLDAKAGETDIEVETFGTIEVTNVSDGRNVDGIETGLELFVPIGSCPDWAGSGPTGTHCSRDIVSFQIPDLGVGETRAIDISGTEEVASVPTADGEAIVGSMLGEEGVVVSADRVFGSAYLDKLNPTCDFGSDSKWITYFTEDPQVTACSTEPGAQPGA